MKIKYKLLIATFVLLVSTHSFAGNGIKRPPADSEKAQVISIFELFKKYF